MKSMTGYGSASAQVNDLELSVEITSVNRRNLEVSIALPKEWISLEKSIASSVRNSLDRGKVNMYINAKEQKSGSQLTWDDEAVTGILEKMRAYSKSQDIDFKPTPELLFTIAKTLGSASELPAAELVEGPVADLAMKALQQLSEMRHTEGMTLSNDLSTRIKQIQTNTLEIMETAKRTVPNYRELLAQRLKQASLELDLSDERVLKEIALFADKCDVAEEITRLESHLSQFLEELNAKGPVGRKLDFICQEIHRELNTIGSKANNIDVTRVIIESKNELERVREQVQNIE